MAKTPILSGKTVIQVLERLGFLIMRQRESHVILRRGSSGCVVPLHQQLKTGTLSGILKQAGVSRREFEDAMNL
ncbi:MAG: type II toxin-antitoxin system HicA family toxin [Bacteroidia bacterium]|nr:type II toxin-antitoxin system HicA family toxin [Bacteroidia bacterium]